MYSKKSYGIGFNFLQGSSGSAASGVSVAPASTASCKNHSFDADCKFRKLGQNVIYFLDMIYPYMSSQKYGIWKILLEGRSDIKFPNDCTTTREKIGYLVFEAILDFTCKGCLYEKLYLNSTSKSKLSKEFFETLINQCLVKVNKLNLIPNSKFDVLECILTGLKEAFTSPDFDKK